MALDAPLARAGSTRTIRSCLPTSAARTQGAFEKDRLVAIAKLAGLDAAAFEACLAEPALAQQVAAETEVGVGLGIQATPTIIVGSHQLRGVPEWETLMAAVEAEEATR